MNDDRVPIPNTHRNVWPESRLAEALTSDSEASLTAWLRPKRGGELDVDAARRLASTVPSQRTYADRKTLEAQTGADAADVDVLRRYCEPFGLEVAAARWRCATVRGPLDALIRAFGATVAIFEDAGGRRFRHRSDSLHAPSGVAAVVRGVFGLHQWPRSRKLGALERHATPLTGRDVAQRYAFPDGDGAGQTIGIVQLHGIFKPEDFDRCMRAQGLSAAHPIVKSVDKAALAHEIATAKDLEAALDVQVVASLAPAARIVVYEGPDDERGFLDAIATAIFDADAAPSILSISYGWPEARWTPAALQILEDLFVAAALTGVSVCCAAGDNGAEVDDKGKAHVVAPASSEFAIACGATVVDGDAERAWENGGGGFSDRFAVPVWQGVAKAEADRYGVAPGRGIPDVAAQQQPGYYVVMEGVELAMGGTSAIAPMWSALIARMNQRCGFAAGFFLPVLYAKSKTQLFTAVTSGSNGKFKAHAGWNACVGLGVPNGTAIEQALRGATR